MRALERAFRRANLPLSYSHGHKPHPKLSYGPPLALGLTSEAEYLDVQLDVPVQQFMINNLIREFAPEFSLLGTKGVFGKTSSLSSQINLAVYEAILPISMTETRERIGQILEADEFKIKRETKAGEIEVEVRSAIIALEGVEDEIGGTHLTMKTGMADLGFIKPGELLEQGFGLDRKQMPAITIHRKEMYRLQDERLIDPFDII
jgi:radical SAM-linked protein